VQAPTTDGPEKPRVSVSCPHFRGRTMAFHYSKRTGWVCGVLSILTGPVFAGSDQCARLPDWATLRSALQAAVATPGNGGLGFNMWGTIVSKDGTVCAVAYSGANFGGQWLASRVISAQKANTANGLSLGHSNTPPTSLFPAGLALSTANLFSAVQPGGSLYGLQHSNPVDTEVAYGNRDVPPNGVRSAAFSQGPTMPEGALTFGTVQDPMVNKRIGGINVFGGGLGLYQAGLRVGGVGVSGDTSCTDHMVAWRVRRALNLDQLQGVGGVSGDPARPDNIVFDIVPNPDGTGGTGQSPGGSGGVGTSPSGFGHPKCLNNPNQATLPAVQ
jgi:hypothetical protein